MEVLTMEEKITGRAKGGVARAMKLTPEQKTEIARKGAKARWENRKDPATIKDNDNKALTTIMLTKTATQEQTNLDLSIQRQTEIDGVGMGVLSDGTAYLTGRGLSRLCGVSHTVIQEIAAEWVVDNQTPRVSKIKDILQARGIQMNCLSIAINQRNGAVFAYPDVACVAILEYYAFDAGINIKEEAKKNYRLLAGESLHNFIYTQVGYDPSSKIPDVWKQFHDRVSLTYNSLPQGFFGIFKEMADVIVTLGQFGLHIDENFVPDISVGRLWSQHWKDNNLSEKYGERTKYEHNYPDYFPQAGSNPQEPWCYPENALGEFRRWFREQYIRGGNFKNYIESKVQQKQLPVSFAQLAISAYGIED